MPPPSPDLFADLDPEPPMPAPKSVPSDPGLFDDLDPDKTYHRDRLEKYLKTDGPAYDSEQLRVFRENADAESLAGRNKQGDFQSQRELDAANEERYRRSHPVPPTAEGTPSIGPDGRTVWQKTKDLGRAGVYGAQAGFFDTLAGVDVGLNGLGLVSDETAQNMHDLAKDSSRRADLGGPQGTLSGGSKTVVGMAGYFDPVLAPLIAGGEGRRAVLDATGDGVLANGDQTKANIVGLASATGAAVAPGAGRFVGSTIGKAAPRIVAPLAESLTAGTAFMAPQPIATAAVAGDDQRLQEQAREGINGLPEGVATMAALGMAPRVPGLLRQALQRQRVANANEVLPPGTPSNEVISPRSPPTEVYTRGKGPALPPGEGQRLDSLWQDFADKPGDQTIVPKAGLFADLDPANLQHKNTEPKAPGTDGPDHVADPLDAFDPQQIGNLARADGGTPTLTGMDAQKVRAALKTEPNVAQPELQHDVVSPGMPPREAVSPTPIDKEVISNGQNEKEKSKQGQQEGQKDVLSPGESPSVPVTGGEAPVVSQERAPAIDTFGLPEGEHQPNDLVDVYVPSTKKTVRAQVEKVNADGTLRLKTESGNILPRIAGHRVTKVRDEAAKPGADNEAPQAEKANVQSNATGKNGVRSGSHADGAARASEYIDSLNLSPEEKKVAQDSLNGWNSELDPNGYKGNIESVLRFTREKALRKGFGAQSKALAPVDAQQTIADVRMRDAEPQEVTQWRSLTPAERLAAVKETSMPWQEAKGLDEIAWSRMSPSQKAKLEPVLARRTAQGNSAAAAIAAGQRMRFTKGKRQGTEVTVQSIRPDGRPVLVDDAGRVMGEGHGISPDILEPVHARTESKPTTTDEPATTHAQEPAAKPVDAETTVTEPTAAEPARESAPGAAETSPSDTVNKRHTLTLRNVLTDAGALPSSATKGKAPSSVWYHQGDIGQMQFDAHVTVMGKPHPRSAEMKAELQQLKLAKADGWELTNRRAGRMGTVWTLEQDGAILTRAGFDSLGNQKFSRPDISGIHGAGYENMVKRQQIIAKGFVDWLNTLPTAWQSNRGVVSRKMGETGIKDWAKIESDVDGLSLNYYDGVKPSASMRITGKDWPSLVEKIRDAAVRDVSGEESQASPSSNLEGNSISIDAPKSGRLDGQALRKQWDKATGGRDKFDPDAETGEHTPVEENKTATKPVADSKAAPETPQEERGYTLHDDKKPVDKADPEKKPADDAKKTVGLSNALSAETRQRFGLPDRETPDGRSFDEMYAAGKERTASDPTAVYGLLDELHANPDRVVSNETEIGMLLKHRVDMEIQLDRLRAELDKVRASGDANGELIASNGLDNQRAAMLEFTELMERSGTAAGRSLAARRMMSAMDYSLSHMEVTAAAAKGSALNKKELADVLAMHEKLKAKHAALEEVLKESNERIVRAEAGVEIERLKRETAEKLAAPTISRLSRMADAARKRIKARGIQFNSGLDPVQLFDLSVIGAEHIAKGISSFAKWSAKMVSDFGDAIRPHLETIFDASEQRLSEGGSKKATEKPAPKTMEEKLQERVADGAELTDLQPYLRSMALDIIKAGTTEREAIIDVLHAQVMKIMPGATREQTRDALSGYGRHTLLDKEAAKVTLREINAESQKLAQLEALQKGERPLATGMERQPLSDKGRALEKQVNEAKRKAGISATQGAGHLKSLLESAKTRARNQINDLQAEIDTGVRLVRGKVTPISDAELATLKAILDTVREQHKGAFGKSQLTDEQRLQKAISIAKSTAEAWDRRLERAKAGDFSVNKQAPISGLEIAAIKARAEAAKAAYGELKANDPTEQASALARSNAAYRARIAERMADLQDRMARQDFALRPNKRLLLDAASLKAQTEAEAASREWRQALEAHEKAKRSMGRKAIDVIKDIPGHVKSLKASLDNSALLRQGWRVMFTNPMIWQRNARKTFTDAWKTFGGKNVMDEIRAEMKLSPYFEEAKKAKLAIVTHEEEFPTSLPGRIPVLGRVFRASEDAYTGFQYRNRLHIFEKMMDVAKRTGVDVTDKNQLRSIGSLVNSLTGRAHLGKIEPVANVVNNFFFSPRKIAADWNFLTLHGADLSFSSFARKQALYNVIKAVSGTAMVLAIANAAMPGSVEDDPKSTDFGKIKTGNTRYDVTGGTAPLLTLAARIWTGKTKSSTTGKVRDLNDGKFGSTSKTDAIASFFGNKLSPIGSLALDHLRNRTFDGVAPTMASDLSNLLIPMAITNFVELQNDAKATPASVSAGVLADFFGIGTNTYDGKKKPVKNNESYWPSF